VSPKKKSPLGEARDCARYWLREGFEPTQICADRFLVLTDPIMSAKRGAERSARNFLNRMCRSVAKWPEPKGRDVKGSPRFVEPLPFQHWFSILLFGSIYQIDGFRRWTGMSVPRKQGKTSHLAKVCLTLLEETRSSQAKGYSFASTEKQASLLLGDAKSMIIDHAAHHDLPQEGKNTFGGWLLANTKLTYREGNSKTWERFASTASGAQGLFPTFAMIDEAAEVPRSLYDAVRLSRMENMTFQIFCAITTAGRDDAIGGWFHSRMMDDLEAMKAGREPAWDWLIWMPDCDRETMGISDELAGDPNVWRRVCPSWGVTVNESQYREEWETDRHDPVAKSAFKTYRLNVWGETSLGTPLVTPAEAVNYCKPEFTEVVDQKLQENSVVLGIDIADATNMTSVAAVCWDENDVWFAKIRSYISGQAYEIATMKHGLQILERFEKSGELLVSGHDRIDHGAVYRQLLQWCEDYRVIVITCDTMERGRSLFHVEHRALPVKVTYLRKNRENGSVMVNALYDAINEKRLIVSDSALFRWEMCNAKVTWAGSDEGGMGAKDLVRRTRMSVGGIDELYALMHGMFFWLDGHAKTSNLSSLLEYYATDT